jgi:hypothetical protein
MLQHPRSVETRTASVDFATRSIATNEFGVGGFWTQALAIYALEAGHLSPDDYNQVTTQLVVLNFRHTTINGSVLIEAARRSEWVNKNPFTSVLNTLGGSQLEVGSVVNVAAEFIFLLWRHLILDFQRDALIMAVLDALTQQRKRDAVVRALEAAIKGRFRLLPLAEVRVRQIITAWRSLRP